MATGCCQALCHRVIANRVIDDIDAGTIGDPVNFSKILRPVINHMIIAISGRKGTFFCPTGCADYRCPQRFQPLTG